MFYDRSHSQTSQVFGGNTTPFEAERPRKVVVKENHNTVIGMGGHNRDLFQFRLQWHWNLDGIMKTFNRIDKRPKQNLPASQRPYMRYIETGFLGAGSFGSVAKAIDVDSGQLMAVKKVLNPSRTGQQRQMGYLEHEVEVLSKFRHRHIVDFISAQNWGGFEVEIFMGSERRKPSRFDPQ
ncbi:hypothetical protein QQX98_008926 [Neonectria punicea]|uniref:Protein kinase domain-containing protein n=1 Tax=Neonectria punicea TaxID=979145 RepID=A0ABR1GTT0_9HYPO